MDWVVYTTCFELYRETKAINLSLDIFKDSDSGLMGENFTVSVVQNQTERGWCQQLNSVK